jgi:DNA invertase Pin-like site-specific DNA recombinase
MDEIARSEKAIIKAGALTLDYSTGKADPMHRAMFQMMGIFAELERGVTVERIVSGIQNAKDKGKRMGRPPLTAENVPDAVLKLIPRYQKGGISVTEFAKKAGVSRQWLYRYFEVLGVEREVKGKTADSLPPKIKKLYRLWCDGKITVAEFSRRAGVGRKTVYRYIKLLKGE